MPKPPKYAKHSSGQARVRILGTVRYLGPYGSPESFEEYGRLLQEWRESLTQVPQEITVRALAAMFMRHAATHYRKRGQPTSELANYRSLLRRLVAMCGRMKASEFSPLKLKRLRQTMIDDGCTRKSINNHVSRIRNIFAWAVSEELIPAPVLTALQTVRGLEAGRSNAREPEPIRPVAEADINAALQHVSRQVGAMIKLQLLTGCRPDEICSLRPCDVDRTAEVWKYTPASHKVEHHDKQRAVFIGPRGQAVLHPFLDDRPVDAFCFSPSEAEQERRALQRANRKTPVQPSQQDRTKPNAKRQPRDRYDVASFRRAIARACSTAGIEAWAPNRLRHSRATDLRRQFGIEAAQNVCGHSRIETTLIYAERSFEQAKRIMAEVG